MGYFHWTDEETYKEITRKGSTLQKIMTWIFGFEPYELVPGNGNDRYGSGVYFTDYGPDYARSSIAGVCFGNSQSQDKVECYFEIEFHGNTKITKEAPHVWLLSPKSTATQHLVDHGYHPDFHGSDDDDDDDDDDDWVPSCNNCNDSSDVSDPGGDYYWCDHCEHDIDDDGDCVSDPCSTCDEVEGECPVCEGEGNLHSEDDDYSGQKIYMCYDCGIYYDEDSELWPSDWDGTCRWCQENKAADDCPKEQCGSCCDGNYCDRHG